MHAQTAAPATLRRHVFTAGKLPRRPRSSEKCTHESHIGPIRYAATYDAHPDPVWYGSGVCAACGSHIQRTQLRRR